jgi:hypothetical protein
MFLPLLQFTLLALSLIASLVIFVSLKRELRRHTKKQSQPVLMRSAPEKPVRSGININNRIEALRLARRGEDPAKISAALGVPRREVELLIRVHQITTPAA